MKKCFWGIISMVMLVMMLVMGCSGGAKPAANPVGNSTANSNGMMTLDQALKEAAARIDERVAAKTKIAPLNFNSPHDKFSGYVLDEVTANLVDSGKLTVVDRKEVDLIRGEFDFQFSGEVGDDSMQQLGRMLGAQSIISGSLTDMGGFYRIVIRVLNVQNASVEVQYRANITSDNVMAALLTGGKTAAVARSPQRTPAPSATQAPVSTPTPVTVPVQAGPVPTSAPTTPTTSTPTPAPVTPTAYKIGDKGPAGGLIFYDKGNNSGGWRYLEAAPASTEEKLKWALQKKVVDGTKEEIGTGKQNTKTIVDYAMRTAENMPAARYCDRLQSGGYNDWFLPSKVELGLMFLNLKDYGLGSFNGDWYWSSSVASSDCAWAQNFIDGTIQGNIGPGNVYYERIVRAIRQF